METYTKYLNVKLEVSDIVVLETEKKFPLTEN